MKLLAGVLGTVLFVLMPLAHGSPIDPSIPGFWDNGDFDDVIVFLTINLYVVDADEPPLVRASDTATDAPPEHPTRAVVCHVYRLGSPRAPPAV